MKDKVTPLHDRVIVDPFEAASISSGGIIIPDNAKDKPVKGKVIAVGVGKPGEPLTVKKGDTVLYGKYSGSQIEVSEKKYLIMRESDILAIV